jgi:hypothetical protein
MDAKMICRTAAIMLLSLFPLLEGCPFAGEIAGLESYRAWLGIPAGATITADSLETAVLELYPLGTPLDSIAADIPAEVERFLLATLDGGQSLTLYDYGPSALSFPYGPCQDRYEVVLFATINGELTAVQATDPACVPGRP